MPSGINSRSALRWATLILCGVALYVCWPLWPALVLAAWTSALARPSVARLERALNGRQRAAGLIVFMVFLLLVTPIAMILAGAIVGTRDMLDQLQTSSSARGALTWIAVGSDGASGVGLPRSVPELLDLARRYGAESIGLLSNIAGAAAKGLLVVFVYFAASFMFILEGRSEWRWVKSHSPLRPEHLDRFMAAFHETGRGLLVGVGLTSLAQAVAATITYVALGVPQGWVLGPITGLAGIVPVIGSTVIWGPIALGLLLTGHPIKALILAIVGVAVISTIDNLLRPVFAKMGALQMPMLLLFVSLFGGLIMFGAWGAIIGPLVVRLAMEAIALVGEDEGEPVG